MAIPTSGELRAMRIDAGLTQIRLAHEAKCSPGSVAQLETGYEPRNSAVRDRILAVLQKYDDAPAVQGERAGTATNAVQDVQPSPNEGAEHVGS